MNLSSRARCLALAAGFGLLLSGCNGAENADTVTNTIQATASVQGAVNAIGGASRNVSVTFVSNDGQPVTDLTVSGLSSLPAGWSGPSSFSCARVTTGSGCVLNVTFAPTTASSGTLSLGYGFTNSDGVAMADTVTIPYSSTTDDNVVASASPTGQINATVSDGSQALTLTFTTDDGQAASGLTLTSPLNSLPPGWSSTAQSFSCATVSTGNACQLMLSFAPQSATSGTLTLDYRYTDNAGGAKTGSASIPYAATSDDHVGGAVSPSGQVTATAGGSPTAVTISFATDDGNPATALGVTGGLGSLPSGWTGPSSFACDTISAGTACQLSLSYAPPYTGGGTLTLSYDYDNDAGNAETGTLNISYLATGPHLYIANLVSPLDECSLGSGGVLSTCVATPATGGLSSPTGIAFYGNTAYVADFDVGDVYVCSVNLDGSLSNCNAEVTGFTGAWALAVSGNYLYMTGANLYGKVQYCQIGTDGSLSNCAVTASGITFATGIAIGGGYAYIAAGAGTNIIDICIVNADGSLSGCASTGSGFDGPSFITLQGSYAYVVNEGNDSVNVCVIGANGTLGSCAQSAISGAYDPNSVVFNGSNAYVDDNNGNLWLCAVNPASGALSGCSQANGGNSFYLSQQMALH